MLIDTHTHLYSEEFDGDRFSAVSKAIEMGVGKMLLPSIDKSYHAPLLKCVNDFKDVCYPMIGVHPTSIKDNFQEEIIFIQNEISKNKYYAIGECGLDYYWDKTFIKEQEIALREQIELSIEYKIPLVIHSRKSLQELIQIIKDYKNDPISGVFHCFPGNIQEANQVIDLGFYLGIGGVVTYKNAGMAEVVKAISLEHILLETDAPYLTPVPFRGKRNESCYIQVIAEKIAELKNISKTEVEETTTRNAINLFKI